MAESPTQGRPNLDWRLLELILVAIGAVPGALIRWQAAGVYFGDGDNVVVNVAGAFILGLLVGRGVDARWQLLVGTGFCGSLTTFSAWMVDCVVLMAVCGSLHYNNIAPEGAAALAEALKVNTTVTRLM